MYRCYNPKHHRYEAYGARGITVYEPWHDFEAWYAVMGDAPPGMTVDRIDNDKGYEPGNLRWATREEQFANRRRAGRKPGGSNKQPRADQKSRVIDGQVELTLSEAAAAIGINRKQLAKRMAAYRKMVRTETTVFTLEELKNWWGAGNNT